MSTKKVIVTIALALLLIGIAYVQALFSSQEKITADSSTDNTASLPSDNTDSPQVLVSDSLRDSLRHFYYDSLYAALQDSFMTAFENNEDRAADSLAKELEKVRGMLDDAKDRVAGLTADHEKQFERLVTRFYANEVEGLPADLSEYEKTVSMKEIRARTMACFDISSQTLDRILKKGK